MVRETSATLIVAAIGVPYRFRLSLAAECRFGQPAHADIEREQAAVHDTKLLSRFRRRHRAGDIERIEVFTPEAAASWVGDRQFDGAVGPAIRRVSRQPTATVFSVPEEAFGVDAGAV